MENTNFLRILKLILTQHRLYASEGRGRLFISNKSVKRIKRIKQRKRTEG